MRRGVWLFPAAPADRLVEAVVAAERSGLDEVWVADEGVAREPMAILAAAARETTTINLAVGITSPVLRHPGALAATASTVDELSGGRCILGLGLGGEMSLAPFGLEATAAARPVARMAEAVATARAVLDRRPEPDRDADPDPGLHLDPGPDADQGVDSARVRYRPPDHAAPARSVPIWIGARGPKLLALAAREADGIFVSGCSPAQHDRVASIRATAVTDGHAPVGLALYQSASDRGSAESARRWDEVGEALTGEVRRLGDGDDPDAATSIGINLVDLLDPKADPVAAVERAAQVLERAWPRG